MLLAVCIMMTALSYAHGLSTELFGTRYAEALRNIESILGKSAKVEADKVIYNKVEYEGMTWDEAYFKFSDGQLVEARFYSRQAGKAKALRHLEEVAKVLKRSHAITKDYEDKHTAFYKGGRSPMDFGHLFTIFVSPYKGGWTTQLRYGPFEF